MTEEMLSSLIDRYAAAITCFCCMGGDACPDDVVRIVRFIRERYPHIKTAWYSGKEALPEKFDVKLLDYLKLGPYIESKGGLKSPTTNQALYRIKDTNDWERLYF